MDKVAIQAMDDLTRKADVVFCSAAGTGTETAEFERSLLAAHGVDFEMFSQASDPATQVAEDARGCSIQ